MTHIELKSVAMRPNHLAENVSYGLKSLTAAISVTAEFRLLLIYFLRLRCFGKNSLSVTHYPFDAATVFFCADTSYSHYFFVAGAASHGNHWERLSASRCVFVHSEDDDDDNFEAAAVQSVYSHFPKRY